MDVSSHVFLYFANAKTDIFAQNLRKESGYPTWIRTMNNASKGRCVTVTPSGNAETQYLQPIRFRQSKRRTIAQKS